MNLSETGAENYDWVAGGVYQLEVTDPVQGGPGGIANRQAAELAKRTRNLHERLSPAEQNIVNLQANKADRESPAFSGVPTVPTADPGTNTQQAASAAFVQAALLALLNSPVLSGIPTVPTAAPGTNTLQAASTAFVQAAIAALVASSPATLDTLNELAVALGNDPNFATTIASQIGQKLAKTANLSDLQNVATARTNLGLGVLAILGSVAYAQVDNSLKAYAALASGAVDLSAYGGGLITLTQNTAFSFSGFSMNKTYLLIVTANGYTPSWADSSKHAAVDGNASLGNSGIFYIQLTCIDATPGAEKLLTFITKGI